MFNVGSGIGTSVIEVANVLKQNYNAVIKITISGNYRLGDIRHNIADLSNIFTKLGFSPKIMFAEGITNFTNWVNTQEVEEDNYEKSINELKEKGLYK